MKKVSTVLLAGGFALCLLVQQSHAQLLHHWDFGFGANRLADSAGSLDLNYAPGEGAVTIDDNGTPEDTSDDIVQMGTASDIVFEPGYNGYGQAYRPFLVDAPSSSTAGAGLTGIGFTSPDQFTIETIVKAEAKTTGSAVNYIFQTRPGDDRGYYLVQDDCSDTESCGRGRVGVLGSIIGSDFGDAERAEEYEDGEWYYLAAAIDLTSTGGQAVADIYAANLSAGETTPNLIADDRTWSTGDPSSLAGATGIFGIGNFAIDRDGDGTPEASQEWFQGAIDYISVYDGLLDSNAVAGNLTARLAIPEPTSLALVCLSSLLLGTRRRMFC